MDHINIVYLRGVVTEVQGLKKVDLPSGGSFNKGRFQLLTEEVNPNSGNTRSKKHLVEIMGKRAEGLMKVLKNDCILELKGYLRTHGWTDNEGKKQFMETVVAEMTNIVSFPEQNESDAPASDTEEEINVKDIPFN